MSQEQFYQIEAYLRGDLPPEERTAFEAELANDPALAEQVAAQQAQRKVAELLIEDELRADVSVWKKELENELRPPVRISWWVIAGAIVALLAVLYFLLLKASPAKPTETTQPQQPVANETPPAQAPQKNTAPTDGLPAQQDSHSKKNEQPPSSQHLALAQSFREEPEFSNAREGLRTKNAAERRFKSAMALLFQKNYASAIDSLRKFQPNDQLYLDAQYNIGCAYYAQGKHSDAIPFLQVSGEKTGYLYVNNARWYLALSLLATDDTSKAKEQIAKILENEKENPPLSEKAKKLQKSMANIQ